MILSHHCTRQAEAKGFDPAAVLLAAQDPDVRYPSLSHPGQYRCIRNGVVAIVDPVSAVVITCYTNVTETPRRPDQEVPNPCPSKQNTPRPSSP